MWGGTFPAPNDNSVRTAPYKGMEPFLFYVPALTLEKSSP